VLCEATGAHLDVDVVEIRRRAVLLEAPTGKRTSACKNTRMSPRVAAAPALSWAPRPSGAVTTRGQAPLLRKLKGLATLLALLLAYANGANDAVADYGAMTLIVPV
jgi:hypothetical protein